MAEEDFQRVVAQLAARRATYVGKDTASTEEKQQMMRDLYADWVQNGNYEKDMEILGFKSPITLAETLSHFVSEKDIRILDCASGTGLLGLELKKRGYLHIDAVEPSEESLDCSRGKQVYSNYICEFIGPNRLPIEDGTYDAICMSAALGNLHVRPDCFPELLRISKPGGYIIFNVRAENFIVDICCKNGKLDDILHQMAANGKVEYLMKKRAEYSHCVHDGKTEYAYIFVLRVV